MAFKCLRFVFINLVCLQNETFILLLNRAFGLRGVGHWRGKKAYRSPNERRTPPSKEVAE